MFKTIEELGKTSAKTKKTNHKVQICTQIIHLYIWKLSQLNIHFNINVGCWSTRYVACFLSDNSSTSCVPREDYKSFEFTELLLVQLFVVQSFWCNQLRFIFTCFLFCVGTTRSNSILCQQNIFQWNSGLNSEMVLIFFLYINCFAPL